MKIIKKALITGITGQDGSDLAELLLEEGYEVHGLKRRASPSNTDRIAHSWTINIALSETEYLNLSREFDTEAPPVIAPFADMTAQVLQAKIAGIRHEPPVPSPGRSSSVLSPTPVS